MSGTLKKHQAGHRSRLRDRVILDPAGAPAYELVELLLGYVYLRRDTKPLAKELLERFDGISGLFHARPEELRGVEGAGPALERFLALLKEVMARFLEENAGKKRAVSLEEVGELARCRLAGCAREEVWAALLDNGNRLLTFIRVHPGSAEQVLISPRDAVEITLGHKASGLILVHNHPGGESFPSPRDRETTHRLRQAMAAVGLRFVDHLILADGKYYSMAQDRLLSGADRGSPGGQAEEDSHA
jgi:DNA repair protein RadC